MADRVLLRPRTPGPVPAPPRGSCGASSARDFSVPFQNPIRYRGPSFPFRSATSYLRDRSARLLRITRAEYYAYASAWIKYWLTPRVRDPRGPSDGLRVRRIKVTGQRRRLVEPPANHVATCQGKFSSSQAIQDWSNVARIVVLSCAVYPVERTGVLSHLRFPEGASESPCSRLPRIGLVTPHLVDLLVEHWRHSARVSWTAGLAPWTGAYDPLHRIRSRESRAGVV